MACVMSWLCRCHVSLMHTSSSKVLPYMHIYFPLYLLLVPSPNPRVEYASAKDCLWFSPLKCKCIRAQMKSCKKQHVNYSHFEGRERQKHKDDTFVYVCGACGLYFDTEVVQLILIKSSWWLPFFYQGVHDTCVWWRKWLCPHSHLRGSRLSLFKHSFCPETWRVFDSALFGFS